MDTLDLSRAIVPGRASTLLWVRPHYGCARGANGAVVQSLARAGHAPFLCGQTARVTGTEREIGAQDDLRSRPPEIPSESPGPRVTRLDEGARVTAAREQASLYHTGTSTRFLGC